MATNGAEQHPKRIVDIMLEERGLPDLDKEPSAEKCLDYTFLNAEALFGRVGLQVPTKEDFTAVGVDFCILQDVFTLLRQQRIRAHFVISPSIPLGESYDQNTPTWNALYRSIFRDNSLPYNSLTAEFSMDDSPDNTFDHEGLEVDDLVKESYAQELQSEIETLSDPNIARTVVDESSGVVWSVSVLSTRYCIDFEESRPFLSQVLALQATRVQASNEVVPLYAPFRTRHCVYEGIPITTYFDSRACRQKVTPQYMPISDTAHVRIEAIG
jgi:hypothetical protein